MNLEINRGQINLNLNGSLARQFKSDGFVKKNYQRNNTKIHAHQVKHRRGHRVTTTIARKKEVRQLVSCCSILFFFFSKQIQTRSTIQAGPVIYDVCCIFHSFFHIGVILCAIFLTPFPFFTRVGPLCPVCAVHGKIIDLFG